MDFIKQGNKRSLPYKYRRGPHWDVIDKSGKKHRNVFPTIPGIAVPDSHSNYLVCKNIYFYSMADENRFFVWLSKTHSIEKFVCIKDELYLYLPDRDLNYGEIQDLIAVFYRYKIDMKQLGKYKTVENENAFKPWRKEIFGKKGNEIK